MKPQSKVFWNAFVEGLAVYPVVNRIMKRIKRKIQRKVESVSWLVLFKVIHWWSIRYMDQWEKFKFNHKFDGGEMTVYVNIGLSNPYPDSFDEFDSKGRLIREAGEPVAQATAITQPTCPHCGAGMLPSASGNGMVCMWHCEERLRDGEGLSPGAKKQLSYILLPCPIHKKPPTLFRHENSNGEQYRVVCWECDGDNDISFFDEEHAIAYWNKRVSPHV